MKYELNEFHRNIKSEDFINDIRDVASKLNKDTVTIDEYNKSGKYHSSSITKRLGSWFTALEMAGLSPSRSKINLSEKVLIDDLKRVYSLIGQKPMSRESYNQFGVYGLTTIKRRFGAWESALAIANIPHVRSLNKKISDEALFEEIERMWILLGKQPTYNQIRVQSKYSAKVYEKRFGSWRSALELFIKYINNDDISIIRNMDSQQDNFKNLEQKCIKHNTSREANYRLRFKVMHRDNFKCCACGTSPAKDPSVILHIDHIIPWSKGGETVIDNLQTLCSKCNLGKSDLDI